MGKPHLQPHGVAIRFYVLEENIAEYLYALIREFGLYQMRQVLSWDGTLTTY